MNLVSNYVAIGSVTLSYPFKYEFSHPSNLAEVPIPGREGGQIQYLGSPQITCTITGLLPSFSDLTGLQAIEAIRSSSSDTSLTIYYNGTQISDPYSGHGSGITWRVDSWSYWPIKGSSQFWGAFQIKMRSKG